jgi:hypothetical protein
MAQLKEEQVRLVRQKSQQAISLAMDGRWKEAIEANREIVADFPADVDAWNRLGRAYMEMGELAQAREAYSRAKELDPFNSIAEKNLRRLANMKEAVPAPNNAKKVKPQVFIEETGKAGIVSLHHLAPKDILARVNGGDPVNLRMEDSRLVIEDTDGRYLGLVDPRHGQRLVRLMKGGNRYTSAVISSTEESMAVIIRETYQDPSQEGQLSFPSKGFGSLRPYVSDKILRRQIEYDESATREPGYSIVGEEDGEMISEEPVEEVNEEEEPEV